MINVRDIVSKILSATIVRPASLQGQTKDSVLLDFAHDAVEGTLVDLDQAEAIATRLRSAAVQSIEGLDRSVLSGLSEIQSGAVIRGPIIDSGTGILTRLEFRKDANRTLTLVLGRPVRITIADPTETLKSNFGGMAADNAQRLTELIVELISQALESVGHKLPSLILSGNDIETPDVKIEGKPFKVKFGFKRADNGRGDKIVLQLTKINFTQLTK